MYTWSYVINKHILGLIWFSRLVKGDGEIVEEIVSKERQKAINKVWSHNARSSYLVFIIVLFVY